MIVYFLPTLSLESQRILPKVLVEQANPQQIKFGCVLFEMRHQIGVKTDEKRCFVMNLKDSHFLNVLQSCVKGHIEVMGVFHLYLRQLLVKLRIFLAFSNDISRRICLQTEYLVCKIHA